MIKTFFYTRLHQIEGDYGFYVQPSNPIGTLARAVATEAINAQKKLLFLECHNGNYTFGVRELLSLKDERNRFICHFTGYQLDTGTPPQEIPYFDALQRQFSEITAEAYEVHELLNQKNAHIPKPYITKLSFDIGTPDMNNAWDQTLRRLINNRSENFLCVFDENGHEIQIPGLSAEEPTLRTLTENRPTGSGWAGFEPSPDAKTSFERTVVPPLNLDIESNKGIFSRLWGGLKSLPERGKNVVRSKTRSTREP